MDQQTDRALSGINRPLTLNARGFAVRWVYCPRCEGGAEPERLGRSPKFEHHSGPLARTPIQKRLAHLGERALAPVL